jgi:hypothetical protein
MEVMKVAVRFEDGSKKMFTDAPLGDMSIEDYVSEYASYISKEEGKKVSIILVEVDEPSEELSA